MTDVALSLWNLKFVLGFLVLLHVVAWLLVDEHEEA